MRPQAWLRGATRTSVIVVHAFLLLRIGEGYAPCHAQRVAEVSWCGKAPHFQIGAPSGATPIKHC